MKKTLNRSLSLLLALVLAVSLAVPALAADEPVTLDIFRDITDLIFLIGNFTISNKKCQNM